MASSSKRQESSETGFAVRPPFGKRFPARDVKAIIRETFSSFLSENPDYDQDLGNSMARAVRSRLKELELPRYKFMVQVIVGENKGEGVRVGTRCLWDTATDGMATETVTTDKLFATAIAFGVYLY